MLYSVPLGRWIWWFHYIRHCLIIPIQYSVSGELNVQTALSYEIYYWFLSVTYLPYVMSRRWINVLQITCQPDKDGPFDRLRDFSHVILIAHDWGVLIRQASMNTMKTAECQPQTSSAGAIFFTPEVSIWEAVQRFHNELSSDRCSEGFVLR